MADFKVLATNHTSFTVSDLERSLSFFQDALGFEVTSKAPRDPGAIQAVTGVAGANIVVAYVRGPDHSLELIEYLGPDDRGSVMAPALRRGLCPRGLRRRRHRCCDRGSRAA